MLQLRDVDLSEVTTLLCDADGNLTPSEEPAFDASATGAAAVVEHSGELVELLSEVPGRAEVAVP